MEQNQERTVRKFVEDNQTIIFMIGVFGALVEFTNSFVKIGLMVHYISFLLLILMQILFYELLKDYKGEKTDGLFLFLSTLLLVDVLIFIYWVIDNLDILYLLRYHFIGFILMILVFFILVRIFKIQKYFKKK